MTDFPTIYDKGGYPPCVGCGFCCVKQVCALGIEFYECNEPVEPPCRGLVWSEEDQRHYCQLILDHGADSKLARMMAIGEGCTCTLNDWYRAPNEDRTKKA